MIEESVNTGRFQFKKVSIQENRNSGKIEIQENENSGMLELNLDFEPWGWIWTSNSDWPWVLIAWPWWTQEFTAICFRFGCSTILYSYLSQNNKQLLHCFGAYHKIKTQIYLEYFTRQTEKLFSLQKILYAVKYGQGGALGLATYLRIGSNLEILTGAQNRGPPSVFSNDTLYRNFERFLTTSRLSMMYHAFFKQGGFVYNLKFGGVIFEISQHE